MQVEKQTIELIIRYIVVEEKYIKALDVLELIMEVK